MEKKKTFIIIVVALLVLSIGITFAYFIAKTGPGASANANVTTGTVDDLKFNVSKENISLNINQFNFASGSGNITDTVTATASLKANSTKNTATYNYYVYFQIESNNYMYTTTDKKPEIVLSITGPNGEITSVDGLKYVSATNADGTVVKGFDITTLGNSITRIANAFEISSTSSTNYTNQDWVFKVSFINLDTNQADNEGKKLTGKVLIQKEEIKPTLADYVISQYTGTQGENSIYHHDASLTNGAEDNSYRFAGANPNNYVCFGSDEATCPTENLYRIIGLIDGKVKLILADGATTTMLGTDEGYVQTYGSSSSYKGNGDLTKIGRYKWNKVNNNTWSTSTTNTINLNTNFLTYLDSKNTKWKNMIADTTWYVGGMNFANGRDSNAKTAYNYEVGANKNAKTTVNAKIGLMYVSDYGFAAAPSAWTTILNNYNDATIKNENWLYIGLYEWTISRTSDVSDLNFAVSDVGHVSVVDVDTSNGIVARPSFSLSSSIKFTSGEGTVENPIRVNL